MRSSLSMYMQTAGQGCLASCMLSQVTQPTEEREHECMLKGLTADRFDWAHGHIKYVEEEFNTTFTRYIEHPRYCKYVLDNGREAQQRPITIEFLKQREEPIVLLDAFFLQGIMHEPHYITIHSLDEYCDYYDPSDGKTHRVHTTVIEVALQSLRTHLLISPQVLARKQ